MENKTALLEMARTGRKLDNIFVVDSHAHIGFWKTGTLNREPSDLIEVMERIGVDVAAISCFAGIGPDPQRGNDIVRNAVIKYPRRFIGYMSINPNYPNDIEAELNKRLMQKEFKGIKIHPAFHDYPVYGKGYEMVYEYAHANELIVLSHSWESPDVLDKLSSKYCNATFIMAHAGAINPRDSRNKVMDRFSRLAIERPNVYMDITFSIAHHKSLELLIEKTSIDKLLFASDFPFLSLPYQLGRLMMARIDDSSKRKILGENGKRLFDLYDY